MIENEHYRDMWYMLIGRMREKYTDCSDGIPKKYIIGEISDLMLKVQEDMVKIITKRKERGIL